MFASFCGVSGRICRPSKRLAAALRPWFTHKFTHYFRYYQIFRTFIVVILSFDYQHYTAAAYYALLRNIAGVLVPYAPQDTLIISTLAFLRTKLRTIPAGLVRFSCPAPFRPPASPGRLVSRGGAGCSRHYCGRICRGVEVSSWAGWPVSAVGPSPVEVAALAPAPGQISPNSPTAQARGCRRGRGRGSLNGCRAPRVEVSSWARCRR